MAVTAAAAAAEKAAEAARWMTDLPREQFDLLLVLTNWQYERGRSAGRAEVLKEILPLVTNLHVSVMELAK